MLAAEILRLSCEDARSVRAEDDNCLRDDEIRGLLVIRAHILLGIGHDACLWNASRGNFGV
jgi:hypothetical protein